MTVRRSKRCAASCSTGRDSRTDGGHYDLVIVGGGIAGTSAAVSAARLGLSVALIQDRPVLGGNGSSEVRVWPEGKTNLPPYPHVGDVVSELVRDRTATDGNAKTGDIYDDKRKMRVVSGEKNIRLFLEQRVNQAEAGQSFDQVRRRPEHADRPTHQDHRQAVSGRHRRRRFGHARRRGFRDDRSRPHGRQQSVERRRLDEERVSDPVRV